MEKTGYSAPCRTVTCDQESHVKRTILTALRMAITLSEQAHTGADRPLVESGLDGVADTAAVVIIRELGMELEYTNLRRQILIL